jgi:hypothetical protein
MNRPIVELNLITLLLAASGISAELFRYRSAAQDGAILEYIFESEEQATTTSATKDQIAEIAAEFMTTFYGVQVGALETQEFRTQPVPFWLVSFSDTVKGPFKQLWFVVVLPDGNVVEPRVEKRL